MSEKCPEVINVDGVEYIQRTSIPQLNKDNYVIVRSARSGVFAGKLIESNLSEGWIKMQQARRLWYWSGAASLSQLSIDGVKNPNECKFPAPVPEITILEVIEIIPCTITAIKSIEGVKIWKA